MAALEKMIPLLSSRPLALWMWIELFAKRASSFHFRILVALIVGVILWLVFVWESVFVIDFLSVSRTFPKIETLYISASVKIPLVTVCPVSFLLRIHSISPRRISSSWRSPLPQFLWFPDGDLCVSRHIVGAAHQMG